MRLNRVGKIQEIVILICALIIVLVGVMFVLLSNDTFRIGTYINGVDCSFLTIESTSEKLEKSMNKTGITLKFADNKEYVCLGAFFEIKVENTDALTDILFKQNLEKDESESSYQIDNLYSINEDKVKEYISSLTVFKESSQTKPENAYLKYDEEEKQMIIEPEKLGNYLKLEDAYNYMVEELKRGETVIDFTEITDIEPGIVSTNKKLISQQEEINKILSTTINYTLHNGETYTLNADKMKDWFKQDDDGYYTYDLDSKISEFVEELNKKGKYLLTSTDFNATGKGKISISFGRKTYAQINQDKEIERIKEMLGTQKSYDLEAIYNPLPDYTNIDTYVELDLTRQRVWMYVNGNCILDTPCVTGNVAGGYSTPPGIFHLTYKDTTTYLEGYNSDGSKYKSFVNFWMPFNGGIGFHDASWRSSFGGRIYMTNGSHGCVNLPYAAAQTIYNNINTSMPIILYAS